MVIGVKLIAVPGLILVPKIVSIFTNNCHLSFSSATTEKINVRMASADEYVLPPSVTKTYVAAPRSGQKHASEYITGGKWKGYTPPPMPKK